MSYIATGGGPGQFPGFPGGLPGPISRAVGPIGPTMAASLFPTHTRVGDVVTVTGPFGGMFQGSVRVKFQGSSWLSPQMIGPATASVVVPEGAETGLCEVEANGRRIFGTNCVIDRGTERVGRPSHKGRDARAWTQRGELMGYIATGALPLRTLPLRTPPRISTVKVTLVSSGEIIKRPAPVPLSRPSLSLSPARGSSMSTDKSVPSIPPSTLLPLAPLAPTRPTRSPWSGGVQAPAPKTRPRPSSPIPAPPPGAVPIPAAPAPTYSGGGGGDWWSGGGTVDSGAFIDELDLELPDGELDEVVTVSPKKSSVLPLILVGLGAAAVAYFVS